MVVIVKLTKNKEAIIDETDTEILLNKWCTGTKKNGRIYAVRGSKNCTQIYMHRVILERMLNRQLEKGEIVDHINRNTLDNRRNNLRIATYTESARNTCKNGFKTGTIPASPYRGVYYEKRGKRIKRWVAQIKVNGKWKWIGLFKTDEEAAKARDKDAKKLFGKFAYLNFPEGEELTDTKEKTCPVCGYTWEPRVKNPKSCSRCKCRLDIKRKTEKSDKKRGNLIGKEYYM
jgi:hypothetical protein